MLWNDYDPTQNCVAEAVELLVFYIWFDCKKIVEMSPLLLLLSFLLNYGNNSEISGSLPLNPDNFLSSGHRVLIYSSVDDKLGATSCSKTVKY